MEAQCPTLMEVTGGTQAGIPLASSASVMTRVTRARVGPKS